MSTVVEELVVELNARTERLEQGLAKARAEIGKTVPTTTAAGAAAGNMGQRYGSAATQIAGAAENMARMGKVTGEASKQVLSQGAQIAFAFGPTGAIVGAVSIATLAIVELFSRARAEAKRAAAEMAADFNRMAAGDSKGTKEAIGKLYFGDRKVTGDATTEQLGILRIMQQIDALQRKVNAHQASSAEVAALAKKRGELEALNVKLATYNGLLDEQLARDARIAAAESDKKDATKAASDARQDAAERERVAAGGAKAQIEDVTQAWERGVARQAAALEVRDKRVAESAKLSEEAGKFLRDALVKQTKTLVDDIERSFEEPMEKAAEAGNWLLLQQLVAARDAAVALRQGLEDVDEQARIVGIDFKDIADAGTAVETKASRTTEELINQARAVQQAVDGALQLAEAFGMVDKNVASSLRAVTQIATNLPALSNAWAQRGGTGKGEGMGALVGAALPVAGAAATLVSGFINAAKAAREHAAALAVARRKLTESLQDRIGRSGLTDQQQRERDTEKQRRDDLGAILDLLVQSPGIRIGTRDEFLAKDESGQRKVLTDAMAQEKAKFPAGFESSLMRALEEAIKQFDLVAESARKAKEELEAELAVKREDIDQSHTERRLRVADREDEADLVAFTRAQEQELADARAGGVYTTEQLIELQSILNDELAKYIADQKKRLDEEAAAKARQVQVDREDLQTRINAADGETPAELERRRGIEKERELLDWMAKGADAATLALVRLAQSADDAAAAARAAMEAQREVQDLDVELLQLQGKTDEAEAKAAELALQRRWDDAVAAGKDPAVLAKLAEVIAAKRAELAAQQAGAGAPAGQGAAGAGTASGGATSAAGTGIGTATIVQVDRMLGLLGTVVAVIQQGNTERIKQTALMLRGSGWAIQPPSIPSEYRAAAAQSMAGATVIQLGGIRVNVIAPDGTNPSAFGFAISQAVLDAINTGLASSSLLTSLGKGQVGR